MRVPKYRRHSLRDVAFVAWQGKRHYLPGKWDSFESRQAYRKFLREHVLGDRTVLPSGDSPSGMTVADVAFGFLQESLTRYGPDPRGEHANVELVMRRLASFCGPSPVGEFGPKSLKAYRQWRLKEGDSPSYVNSQVNRIKRAFRWAVSEEIIPAAAVTSLETVNGLDSSTKKRETVAWEHVETVLPNVNRIVRAMILLQWYTGARSDSICNATPAQFERRLGDIWYWRPVHKTEKTRKLPLVLPVGPQAQAAIGPFLDREENEPLFCPWDVARRSNYRRRYAPGSYRQAILRGIARTNADRADDEQIPHWHPHQLRHTRGQLVRERYGAEAAQGILGHESLDATEIYTSRLLSLAVTAAKEMG